MCQVAQRAIVPVFFLSDTEPRHIHSLLAGWGKCPEVCSDKQLYLSGCCQFNLLPASRKWHCQRKTGSLTVTTKHLNPDFLFNPSWTKAQTVVALITRVSTSRGFYMYLWHVQVASSYWAIHFFSRISFSLMCASVAVVVAQFTILEL